ncbi:hypothetical protein QA646_03700 [Rhizobium sp. CB3090]|uniref:hypothetical protein n=1 Tax=Rhizobium sp. CB3090 TaxID=3039156 RepID=UPI0024B0DE7A|nr:hypothetical protein [Rhizobium sp. CB3090]WFU09983.1 hypothetical protein QA646_03700 [Rhizobium sp. CB3090]
MSGISSVGSSMSAASYNPLDKNHDGVVDAQELQEAAQSGLPSASALADESTSTPSNSDQNPLEVFIREMEASMNVFQDTYDSAAA